MKAYQALLALSLCLLAGLASAEATGRALDINLNDDAVRAGFAWPVGSGNTQLDVGWLHNQDRGDVLHASFHLVDSAGSGNTPLDAGLGLRLVYTETDPSGFDGTALALGGFARYTLPNADRFNIGGSLYYAPDVVAFGDQTEYYEISVRVGYNVLRDADVYIGFREIKAEYEGAGRLEYDSSLHVGFEFRF
ncbi:MAG: YfaZ family outer membrane protein [Pseudomonadota bacterium]